jgi:hypothetical protein
LRVPLAHRQAVPIQAEGEQQAIRVRYFLPATASVRVALVAGNGATISRANSEIWDGGSGSVLVPLANLSWWLSVKGGRFLATIAFLVPRRACITGLSLGALHAR